MKNVIAIIKAHGGLEVLKSGTAIRIDPPSEGYMRLCIEYIGKGPARPGPALDRPLLSSRRAT
jgi:hypothetical protein